MAVDFFEEVPTEGRRENHHRKAKKTLEKAKMQVGRRVGVVEDTKS